MLAGKTGEFLSMRAPAESGVDDDAITILDMTFSLARHRSIGFLGHCLGINPLVQRRGVASGFPGDALAHLVGIDHCRPQPRAQRARQGWLAAAGQAAHEREKGRQSIPSKAQRKIEVTRSLVVPFAHAQGVDLCPHQRAVALVKRQQRRHAGIVQPFEIATHERPY